MTYPDPYGETPKTSCTYPMEFGVIRPYNEQITKQFIGSDLSSITIMPQLEELRPADVIKLGFKMEKQNLRKF